MNNTMMKSMSKYNNGTKSDARPKKKPWTKEHNNEKRNKKINVKRYQQ